MVCSPHLGSVLCLCCGLQTCGLCESWIVCIFCADVSVCVCLCVREEGVWVPAQVCVVGSWYVYHCVCRGPSVYTGVCVRSPGS